MSAVANPLKGKPTASTGDAQHEIPSQDTHEARLVALIDLGTHEEAFQGADPKPKRKFYLVWELDEKMSASTYNHVIGKEYTLSFHEKASLRLLAEQLINDGNKFPDGDGAPDIDYTKLLNAPCMVTIKHEQSEKRSYAKIAGIGPVPKSRRDKVFRPGRKPTTWFVGCDLGDLPDWLPWYYGRPLSEKIKESRELSGRSHGREGQEDDEGEIGGANETPF